MRTPTALTLLLILGLARTADASSGCSWQVYKPPNLSQYQLLVAVDAISDGDVWAGGYYVENGIQRVYFEHFDGNQWTVFKAAPKLHGAIIHSIAHYSSSDVWAAGWAVPSGGGTEPITLHWNGHKWSVFANAASAGQLVALVRVGKFLYATGFGNPAKPMIERFDGNAWSLQQPYVPGGGLALFQAAAGTSPNNVWAGGYYHGGADALIERLDPKTNSWVQVASPAFSYVESMSARSDREIWALGTSAGSVQKWNGKLWKLVEYPRHDGPILVSIDAASSTGYTWVAGWYDAGNAQFTSFADRYLNGQWEETPVVQVGTWGTGVGIIASVPNSLNAWAVGSYSDGSPSTTYTLAERWTCPVGTK